ncbi:PepSY-associated TM helix domain-containing protein [Janthinobacterium psychrotolerans]|uniref:PepSY-associated TM region n=1 Tax=Janthinobacterium psychrotolerans TaxID=1747903 RepID=A0A1A7BYJ3_9BURK|nr:PepSY-associated TM helix domain-containing protein [Janthinobacterium psychrotolerans]OBV38701.1 PepSY-associated TM region [Janthinobacterium psychrotolerans]
MMSTLKRLLYQLHRWTGVAACVLMLLWFISGMVMLFVGYPKLTPWERLAALPPLPLAGCCQPLAQVAMPVDAREIVLTTVAGRPGWKVRDGGARWRLVDAVTGKLLQPASRDTALASARAFVPGAGAHYLGLLQEDRWTHSRSLDAHRPLHQVQLMDAAQTMLYLSSATGEVVLDAPRDQRLWNFVGAWLHWVYPLRNHSTDPVWNWIIIISSAVATLTALTGTVAGIWRWRFAGRYKSGARTPYRESWMRWHHVTGLLFAGFVFAWIFSGLISMNPFHIFDPQGRRPDLAAWQGGTPAARQLDLAPQLALSLLAAQGFRAVELEWRVLNKQPYLLARDGAARTRLIMRQDGQLVVREQWTQAQLLHAASKLLPGIKASSAWLGSYDSYYYGREPEAMMGAVERRLPVLQLRFDDPQANWVYLDPYTGTVALGVDRRQRVSRWLFSFLHSWDLPPLLRSGPWRESVLILLSLGGLALSATGMVIGWRRLRGKWRAVTSGVSRYN